MYLCMQLRMYTCMYVCMYVRVYVHMYICSYHSLISSQGAGGWSTEGIIQDDDPGLPVLCKTTHLTSFSVLQQQQLISAKAEVWSTVSYVIVI